MAPSATICLSESQWVLPFGVQPVCLQLLAILQDFCGERNYKFLLYHTVHLECHLMWPSYAGQDNGQTFLEEEREGGRESLMDTDHAASILEDRRTRSSLIETNQAPSTTTRIVCQCCATKSGAVYCVALQARQIWRCKQSG